MRVHIPGPSRTKDRPTSVDLIRCEAAWPSGQRVGLAIRQGAGGGGGGRLFKRGDCNYFKYFCLRGGGWGGDYSIEAINRWAAIIGGNTVYTSIS